MLTRRRLQVVNFGLCIDQGLISYMSELWGNSKIIQSIYVFYKFNTREMKWHARSHPTRRSNTGLGLWASDLAPNTIWCQLHQGFVARFWCFSWCSRTANQTPWSFLFQVSHAYKGLTWWVGTRKTGKKFCTSGSDGLQTPTWTGVSVTITSPKVPVKSKFQEVDVSGASTGNSSSPLAVTLLWLAALQGMDLESNRYTLECHLPFYRDAIWSKFLELSQLRSVLYTTGITAGPILRGMSQFSKIMHSHRALGVLAPQFKNQYTFIVATPRASVQRSVSEYLPTCGQKVSIFKKHMLTNRV